MKRLKINENAPLMDIYNFLIESRGVIDGIDEIVEYITDFANGIIGNRNFLVGRNEKEKVTLFSGECQINSNDVNTLFMLNPCFKINIFVMDNRFGDRYRNLGENCYYSPMYPDIESTKDGIKLKEPKFELSFIIPMNAVLTALDVSSKLGHELVHAKKNFNEYISVSKKREGSISRDAYSLNAMNNTEKDEVKSFVGNILYLCSKDEINARANQLYYELKSLNIFLTPKNINSAIKKCSVYEFLEKMDWNYSMIDSVEKENRLEVEQYVREILKNVYLTDSIGNPFSFLKKLLINRKNIFIRQIDKVKHRVLYEALKADIKK